MKVLAVMNGEFGSKVLKSKYKRIWKAITYGTLSLIVAYTFLQFVMWWSGVVEFLNFMIWGI